MSNYKTIKALVTRFAGQQNTIGVPRVFCQMMGGLEGGAFLSQLVFWGDKGGRADGWFYKTYEEWEAEIMLSPYKIRKYSEQLKERGVLQTSIKRADGAPTVHYRFDYEIFKDWIVDYLAIHTEETSESLTETTTEEYTDTDMADVKLKESTIVSVEQDEPDGRAWFISMADLCEVDLAVATKRQKQQLGQSSKLLKDKASATPEQIVAFGKWWYANDWRGKQGQASTPAQVREAWGAFKKFADKSVVRFRV